MSEWIIPRLAIIDPALCATMPPKVTAETGLDALAHCIEGYVCMASPYHPYYEALALYGVKLVGRSLRKACNDGRDLDARADMCMAALNGGLCLSKGLGVGHAIGHALGAKYHIPHGKAVALGLLCFVRANREACLKQFSELAWALDGSDDIETPLVRLYEDVGVPTRLRDSGMPEGGLPEIAFETSKDAVNLARNPAPLSDRQILELLRTCY
jgi:alcohol dehydrogenase class IV